ncbi:AI-2E family transporter [Haloarcula onubensis]|uniref:AI-2E family transporter n=1 Tax=Haloarcula onubensis TaxID=2950539 RepID=A0ABU2FV17_9EURY|nr:AI-2E family transporter [Halomicroarcula sp. S3CR25-11]MDS0284611.1 AI-2E family transporter [Halomicroarcula sp. S3CR25-11]
MVDTSDIPWLTGVWGVAGLLIVASVAFVLYSFVGALVVGLFLYYALRPVSRRVERRLERPNVSAALTLLVVGIPMLAILSYAGLVGAREADAFLRQVDLPQVRTALGPYIDIASATAPRNLVRPLRDIAPELLELGSAVFVWALRLFVVVTVAFYLLRDDRKISTWVRATFERNYGVVTFLEGVDDDLSTIYTGNLITILLTTVIAVAVFYGLDTVAPAATGVVFPVLLGLLTGVATLIPAIGIKLIYFPYTGYLLWIALQNGAGPLWFPVAFFLVTFALVDVVPDFVIRAEASKGDHNLGLMLLTYTIGAVVFGWYGVFLAPILLVVFLHFMRDVLPNLLDRRTDEVVSRGD